MRSIRVFFVNEVHEPSLYVRLIPFKFVYYIKFVDRGMIQKLHIQNYAIIDELEIDFSGELNIITGETGAGKSILMGALSLILGQRADSSVLQNNSIKCIVEATFVLPHNEEVKSFLNANEFDVSNEVIVRREILTSGKSRGFINDSPANLSQLKLLGILLVDLHQQFDTLELGNENFQRQVLDALADNFKLLVQLKQEYASYSDIQQELKLLKEQQSSAHRELDYNRFLFDELEELSLKENELENLEDELKILNNAEQIKSQLSSVYSELKDGERPLVHQLKSVQHKLNAIQHYHPRLTGLLDRIRSTILELEDVADELEQIDESVQFDEERISISNERLSAGYKLLKKHGVKETAQLLSIMQSLQNQLDEVNDISEKLAEAESGSLALLNKCNFLADTISTNRAAHVKAFTEKVNYLLLQVGMPNARLKVELTAAKLSATGSDEVAFLFDANRSNRYEPLAKVASGGELSRLMLSIKSLVAKKLALPTLIFDEIDTGISGEAARQVGIIMKSLASEHQLIVVSHQPQIAAKASAHYFVFKQKINNKIATSIRLLNTNERITTIAQMLSGEKPTAAALENAREMVAG